MLRTWNMNQSSGHLVNVNLMGPLAYQMAMMDHHKAMTVEAKHMAEAEKAFWDHKREAHQELYGVHEKFFKDMGGMAAMMSMMPMPGMGGVGGRPGPAQRSDG
ncbi:MAG: hypothetical protein M1602_06850 [Firmicutes bacterium]|nr:hypothetical protein [Bacillota bacterium]